ncbi:o-succinylbenzoate synthase [Gordonia sp. (in: high G+C Gram-positive bacteria)]|uniref:o-succinylbenzoate synthase n=1 Tax=Gordonia sp. (in: high G+C Gram-positive bacteria) TaxID=84139 RepID=UPI0039E4D4BA
MIPPLDDLLATATVVSLPMRVRFRGITVREALLFRGPAGWGEFSPFTEYDDAEASNWLAAGIEAAWLGPPPAVRGSVEVNATVPAVAASEVAQVLARFPGARTAKVKVAERGQSLREDLERVAAVRDLVPTVRVDANGGWTAQEAVTAITQLGELEYVEQPCATVEELAQVRRRVNTPIAADESIRKADDPLRVVAADAADIAVVKVAPLGGMRRVLELADQIRLPIVVSSALDTAIGINAGIATAAALPTLEHACGLGTGALFVDDVTPDLPPVDNATMRPTTVTVDDPPLAAPDRRRWWLDRLARCHGLLADTHS